MFLDVALILQAIEAAFVLSGILGATVWAAKAVLDFIRHL